MLKTVSAALLAVSVFAMPALAATSQKTTPAPVAKSASTSQPVNAKSALNANAKTGRHHVRHSTHHRANKKMTTHKMHKTSKVTAKHVTHPAKRG